jgi:hypothetical protein
MKASPPILCGLEWGLGLRAFANLSCSIRNFLPPAGFIDFGCPSQVRPRETFVAGVLRFGRHS